MNKMKINQDKSYSFTDRWALNKKALAFIIKVLAKKYKTVLELGSGTSTTILTSFFDVTSIEENEEWVGKYESNYIHAPIKDGWYDLDVLSKSGIKEKKYDILIIDGPANGERLKFLDNLNLFNLEKSVIIIDDIERNEEKILLEKIKEVKNKVSGKATVTTINNTAFII